jgi:hypothetical protein
VSNDGEMSPFDRPEVSEGYPLDRKEERAVREELERLRPAAPPQPLPPGHGTAREER